MVPLSARIRLGLYRDGVWADAGFLPYGAHRAHGLPREAGDRAHPAAARRGARRSACPCRREEYGAVRKVLEEKIRERVVNVEAGILGL